MKPAPLDRLQLGLSVVMFITGVASKYYVALLCKEDIQPMSKTNQSIGIDLGISDFAICSDGQKIDNHQFTHKMAKKLAREQRKLSRRLLLAKQRKVDVSEAKNYQKSRCYLY